MTPGSDEAGTDQGSLYSRGRRDVRNPIAEFERSSRTCQTTLSAGVAAAISDDIVPLYRDQTDSSRTDTS